MKNAIKCTFPPGKVLSKRFLDFGLKDEKMKAKGYYNEMFVTK